MLEFTVEVQGLRETEFKLETKRALLPHEMQDAARDIGYAIEGFAKDNAPHRSGNLYRSIGSKSDFTADDGASVTVSVGRGAYYANWVEEGTGLFGPLGHFIYPTKGKVMVFPSERGFGPAGDIFERGKVFARRTKGQKGQHFMHRALDEAFVSYIPRRLAQLARDASDI